MLYFTLSQWYLFCDSLAGCARSVTESLSVPPCLGFKCLPDILRHSILKCHVLQLWLRLLLQQCPHCACMRICGSIYAPIVDSDSVPQTLVCSHVSVRQHKKNGHVKASTPLSDTSIVHIHIHTYVVLFRCMRKTKDSIHTQGWVG